MQKFFPPELEYQSGFGRHISVDGDVAIIQDTFGHLFEYVRHGNEWKFREYLPDFTLDDVPHSSSRGQSAFRGNLIIKGATGGYDVNMLGGIVYVFRHDGNHWQPSTTIQAADGHPQNKFGESVIIGDDFIAVGAPHDDEGGQDAGAVYIFRMENFEWRQFAKLIASDSDGDDNFGSALAYDQGTLLVGAPGDEENGERSGSVYVYRRSNKNRDHWIEMSKLIASDGVVLEHFGISISIDGNTTVIGTNRRDPYPRPPGRAHVFRRVRNDDDKWIASAILQSPNEATRDYFGSNVSIRRDTILVGAHAENVGPSTIGATHLYRRARSNTDVWLHSTMLRPIRADSNGAFGAYVSIIDNDSALISCPFDGEQRSYGGAVFLIDISEQDTDRDGINNACDNCPRNHNPNQTDRDYDGIGDSCDPLTEITVCEDMQIQSDDIRSLSNNREWLAAGVPSRGTGSVRIFHKINGIWELESTFEPEDGQFRENFGRRVVLNDRSELAVLSQGSFSSSVPGQRVRGVVYIYHYDGEIWLLKNKITLPELNDDSTLSWDMDFDEHFLVIGTPFVESEYPYEGAVYLYRRAEDGTGEWKFDQILRNPTPHENAVFGLYVALDNQQLVVTSASPDETPPTPVVSIYNFEDDSSGSWTLEQTITSAEVNGDFLGWEYELRDDLLATGSISDDHAGHLSGSVQVFRRVEGVWKHEAKLISTLAAPLDLFGSTVAITSSNDILVGAHYASIAGFLGGGAFVFSKQAGSKSDWKQSAIIVPEDNNSFDFLGYVISATDDQFVVYAPNKEIPSGRWGGMLYFYDFGTLDSDADDIVNSCDNCPDIPNNDQLDSDNDGRGDACDPLADINNDGIVNVIDLLMLLSSFGVCDPPPSDDCPADLDGNGVVDVRDLLTLLQGGFFSPGNSGGHRN